jgi:hypothetical protein
LSAKSEAGPGACGGPPARILAKRRTTRVLICISLLHQFLQRSRTHLPLQKMFPLSKASARAWPIIGLYASAGDVIQTILAIVGWGMRAACLCHDSTVPVKKLIRIAF